MATSTFHHGNLREACLNKALELLDEEGGVEELSLRRIARSLGVSHNAPYRHFPSREALLVAMTVHCIDEIDQQAIIVATDGEPLENFLKASRIYLEFVIKYPARYRLMMSNTIEDTTRYPELTARVLDQFQFLTSFLTERGGPGGDSFKAALAMVSVLHGFCSLVLEKRLQFALTSPDQYREHLDFMITTMWRGLVDRTDL